MRRFIPKITGEMAMDTIDKVISVPGAKAIRMSNESGTKEGIFVGITSAPLSQGGLRICPQAPEAPVPVHAA